MKKLDDLTDKELYTFIKSMNKKEKSVFMKYYLEKSKNIKFSLRLIEIDKKIKKNENSKVK